MHDSILAVFVGLSACIVVVGAIELIASVATIIIIYLFI